MDICVCGGCGRVVWLGFVLGWFVFVFGEVSSFFF